MDDDTINVGNVIGIDVKRLIGIKIDWNMFLLLFASGFRIVMRQLFSCQRYLTLIILSELSEVRELSLL